MAVKQRITKHVKFILLSKIWSRHFVLFLCCCCKFYLITNWTSHFKFFLSENFLGNFSTFWVNKNNGTCKYALEMDYFSINFNNFLVLSAIFMTAYDFLWKFLLFRLLQIHLFIWIETQELFQYYSLIKLTHLLAGKK